MPIDRSFIVQGHGTVVTGSVIDGSLRVGDEVEWLPSRQRRELLHEAGRRLKSQLFPGLQPMS